MTYDPTQLFGEPSRLSQVVRNLGYSGSPLPLDEWLKLQAIIVSMQAAGGPKRVNLPSAIVSCAQCGKNTVRQACDVVKHQKNNRQHFYCSNVCWGRGENLHRHGARICVRCGAAAPRRASWGAPAAGRIFCSKECLTQERAEEFEHRALTRMQPCKTCNGLFIPWNSNSEYCSRPCASRKHAAAMVKQGNPMWKDGAAASRVKPHVTRRFREMRPLIMRRDGQRCVLCAATENLHVHHIDENPLNNRAVNLITLCPPCHNKAHFSSEKATLCETFKTLAETPMSSTYKWKERSASSPTASSATIV